MVARHSLRWIHISIAAVALVAVGLMALPATAAGPLDKLDTSLKLIPEDAAFYSSMLRNREQFEILRKSNAWTKIQQMPVVQMGLSLYRAQLADPNSGPAKVDVALQNPETRKIVDLLAGMVSEEVFLYGDESNIDFMELVQNIAGAMRYGPMTLQATGEAEGRNPNQLQAMMLLSALAEHADLIDVPNFVVGFKMKDKDLAKEQLIKLETLGNILLEGNEKTKGHFKKTKVGDYEYLVLELNGGMVPWDQVPVDTMKEIEAEEGDAQKVIDRLKELKLVVALGIRENYLLVSIGSSLDALEGLGGSDRLIDRPEFKPLEKLADKRITSIGYVSKEMSVQINNQGDQIDDLVELLDKVLPAAHLSDEQNERIQKDVESFADDLKAMLPESGAAMSVSFLTDRGLEGYQYDWGDHDRIDGSKSLGLLEHVGGNPLLAALARAKVRIDDYDLMAKWIGTAYGYVDDLVLPNMPESEREKARKFLTAAVPLLKRLDKANREMLIPALADGQSALVMDGKLTSKQFIASLPATEKPMPMVEPAVVVGVSDAKLLKKAMGEYREVANALIDIVRKTEGSNVPANVQIPEPQTGKGSSGEIFSYVLPKEWGVDEKIVPNFGLSEHVAVFSLSRDHTERLLNKTPPAVGGVIEKTDRQRAAACWFNWAAFLDTASPWIDVAAEQAMNAKNVEADQRKAIVEQVHTAVEVLKTVRSVTSESYAEGEALVNHTQLEIRDVGK